MSSFPVCHFLLVFPLVIHMKENIVLLSFIIYNIDYGLQFLTRVVMTQHWMHIYYQLALLCLTICYLHPLRLITFQRLTDASGFSRHPYIFVISFIFWSKRECSHWLKCRLLYLLMGLKVENLDSLTPLAPICLTSFPLSYSTQTPSRLITIVLMCKSD